jgi:hypothetical protein
LAHIIRVLKVLVSFLYLDLLIIVRVFFDVSGQGDSIVVGIRTVGVVHVVQVNIQILQLILRVLVHVIF